MAELRGSSSVAHWRPATGGVPGGQEWVQYCSTHSSVTWVKGKSAVDKVGRSSWYTESCPAIP